MNAVRGGKIVAGWACDAFSLPEFHVHQEEYPEMEAAGRTPAEARGRLIGLLSQAVEFNCVNWKSQRLSDALADARAFDRRCGDGAGLRV